MKYGHVAGLVTIEDVLEQIVGEIEDEYDVEEEDGYIKKSMMSLILLKQKPQSKNLMITFTVN